MTAHPKMPASNNEQKARNYAKMPYWEKIKVTATVELLSVLSLGVILWPLLATAGLVHLVTRVGTSHLEGSKRSKWTKLAILVVIETPVLLGGYLILPWVLLVLGPMLIVPMWIAWLCLLFLGGAACAVGFVDIVPQSSVSMPAVLALYVSFATAATPLGLMASPVIWFLVAPLAYLAVWILRIISVGGINFKIFTPCCDDAFVKELRCEQARRGLMPEQAESRSFEAFSHPGYGVSAQDHSPPPKKSPKSPSKKHGRKYKKKKKHASGSNGHSKHYGSIDDGATHGVYPPLNGGVEVHGRPIRR